MSKNPGNRLVVYVIEDEPDLREIVCLGLTRSGFDVTGFTAAPPFYRALVARRCDIAVIDVGLPGEDGFSIAAQLQAAGGIGVVMLTARGALADRVRGLRQGADAYLVKPVVMRELTATLTALARRLRATASLAPATGDWQLTGDGWILRAPNNREIPLTGAERTFVQSLFERRGDAVDRDSLARVLGSDPAYFDPHRLDSLVNRLRRKFANAGLRLPLRAIRGVGYAFGRADAPEA